MAFISASFYLFLAVVVLAYYLVPLRVRWVALLAGSLWFYFWLSQYDPARLAVLVGAALVCWGLALLQRRIPGLKRLWLGLALAATALPLLVLKEAPFFLSHANRTAPDWLVAPVGFSFYTLQLIAYTVDVSRGKTEPQGNFLKFLLFVSFFPQILQGPIPRYDQLGPQLLEGHRFEERTFVRGFLLLLWGFFLKLCIADKAGVVVDTIFDNYPAYPGAYVLVAGVLYSFQLYADFLACTSFAQGAAELVGIRLADNFHRPYLATSVQDFWRRWHISLSSWLKDYIYIPLGGNRKGTLRKYLNLLLTFAVSGIWHGAGYKFLAWGLIHGFYQIAGALLRPVRGAVNGVLGMPRHPRVHTACQRLLTFLLVMFAWILFRADTLSGGLSMIRSVFTVPNFWIFTNDALFTLGLVWKEWGVLLVCLGVLLAAGLWQEKGIVLRDKILQAPMALRWAFYIGTILFVMVFGTYGYGFDAQAFIYGGF